jgi:hypothetical protein
MELPELSIGGKNPRLRIATHYGTKTNKMSEASGTCMVRLVCFRIVAKIRMTRTFARSSRHGWQPLGIVRLMVISDQFSKFLWFHARD